MKATNLCSFFVWQFYLIGVTMAKTLKTSPEDRTCNFPSCKRLLSIYNHSAYCRIHRDQASQKKVLEIPYHHPT